MMAQQMTGAMRPPEPPAATAGSAANGARAAAAAGRRDSCAAAVRRAADTKFCMECGKHDSQAGEVLLECGTPQQ